MSVSIPDLPEDYFEKARDRMELLMAYSILRLYFPESGVTLEEFAEATNQVAKL